MALKLTDFSKFIVILFCLKPLMTCYGPVQVNKHNLLCFVVKNSAVIKINKNIFHSMLQINYSGLYSPKDLRTSWASVDD